jgi:non-ribosomal peptide synthetase component E (peptide arylation enzyme)
MPMRKTGAIMVPVNFRLAVPEIAYIFRERIAHFKLPKKIIFVEEFPHNSMGKILKKELKGQLL